MTINVDDLMIAKMVEFRSDPLGFVRWAFPWKQPGLPLAQEEGPDEWQADVLRSLGQQLEDRERAATKEPIRIAVAAGHGASITALQSWVLLWFMSTRPHARSLATAGTYGVLLQKVWPELQRWHSMSVNREWFQWSQKAFALKDDPFLHRADAVPWEPGRPELFAGMMVKDFLAVFDAASSIPNEVWDAVEAGIHCPGGIWLVGSQPTRTHVDPDGLVETRFRECWTARRHRWTTFSVDSRTIARANQGALRAWVEDYGQDSDFVRVRVRGLFPRG